MSKPIVCKKCKKVLQGGYHGNLVDPGPFCRECVPALTPEQKAAFQPKLEG